MILEIARYCDGRAWRQRFWYEPQSGADTVATALTALNETPELRDAEGNPASPIRWACSCLQRKCGACAMVINGKPKLACAARLSEYKREITLEPLKKFPVVEDLLVDRGVMLENLQRLQVWLDSEPDPGENELSYEASRCLQCGCCLEVCPNFAPGEDFGGMAAGIPMSRLLAEAPTGALRAQYRRGVYDGCGKSLACRNVCPAEIDIDRLLVKSNAAVLWKRRKEGNA